MFADYDYMKKEFIIGIGAVATAGMIIGAVAVFNPLSPEKEKDEIQSNKEKVEQLWLDELKDESKYSFCLAEGKIETAHSDPLLAAQGLLKHDSKEVLLYDKQKQKLFVMVRELKFSYDGVIKKMGGLSLNLSVKEHGSLTESYGRNEMPIRIDYYGNYIATDPDTKKKDWVVSDINGEQEAVSSRTGCAGVYQLDNSPGQDLLVGGEQILINKSCKESDISGSYDGSFSFNCQMLDAQAALEMVEEYKSKEAIDVQKIEDSPALDPLAEPAATAINEGVEVSGDEDVRRAIEDSGLDAIPTVEDIKKQLQGLGEDVRGSMRSESEDINQ
jgi:hypothetical protein